MSRGGFTAGMTAIELKATADSPKWNDRKKSKSNGKDKLKSNNKNECKAGLVWMTCPLLYLLRFALIA
jgi:hypothetical protein